MKRPFKQLIYGSFFALFFGLLVYGVYALFVYTRLPSCSDGRKNQGEEQTDCGGSCAPCALRFVQSIATTTPRIIEIDANRTSAIVEVRNPNSNFGADPFSYSLNFYDQAGDNLFSRKGTSFIYGGEIKSLIEPLMEIPFSEIARGELVMGDISWKLADQFIKPDVQLAEIKTEIFPGKAVVSGFVVNNAVFKLVDVGVSTIVFSGSGVYAGVSKTLLRDIDSFSRGFFSITVPVVPDIAVDPKLTKVSAEAKRI